jgi:RHS repeat-associated protein
MVTAIKPYMTLNGMPMARAYRYDQLNRIKDAYTYDEVELDSNLWKYTGSANPDYEEHFSFDANGNILTLTRNGTNTGGNTRDMDDFTYHYITNSNQLSYVDDSKASGNYSDDIDDQSSGNYTYDAIGNLISDAAEQIATIEWTVYGKIKSITRTGGSSKPDLEFEYSPDGHRVIKKVTNPNGNISISYYIRDAQGNVMSVYTRNIDTLENDTLTWSEAHIYGSSRLGMYKPDKILYGNSNPITNYISGNGTINTRGDKNYELSNHLGNVLVVITDKRTASCNEEEEIIAYEADIIDATDYYAYGSPMPMRRNLVQCSVVTAYDTTLAYTKNEDFNSGGTGGFTASTGSVSNPTGYQLHMTANWTSKPLATTSVYLINGRSYTLKLDVVGFSVVSGFSHTVRVRVVLPGAAFNTDFTTTGTKTITFTSNTTGYVNIEIRSIISPPTGVYSGNPYIDIDNFKVSWDSAFTSSDTVCVSKSGYSYGFNGKRIDESEEGMGGGGSTYDYGFRIYNPGLGRFLSVDPLSISYPWYTPYQFAGNKPIIAIDIDGLEEAIVTFYKTKSGQTIVRIKYVDPKDRKDGEGFDYIDQTTNPNNTSAVRRAELILFSAEYMLFHFKTVEYYVESESGTYTDAYGKKYEKKTGSLKDAFGHYRSIPTKDPITGNIGYTMYRSFSTTIYKSMNIFFNNDEFTIDKNGINPSLNNLNTIKSQLDEIGRLMQSNDKLELNIIGYTDRDASDNYNTELAQKRIDAIKNYLKTNFNIDESRFNTNNQGKSQSDKSKKNASDRKVELTLVENNY